jgi:hypothetical protein
MPNHLIHQVNNLVDTNHYIDYVNDLERAAVPVNPVVESNICNRTAGLNLSV